MKKYLLRALVASTLFSNLVCVARADMLVFDPNNYAQNIITAAKSVAIEINSASQTVDQDSMLYQQLLSATKLPGAAMQAQLNVIQGDINASTSYLNTMQNLYGSLQSGSQWIQNVQGLVASSGKTPTQWLTDQATLAAQGSQAAINLFQSGNNIAQHQQTLMQQRQSLQTQLNLSQTQQATASLTTHYLDVISSQMTDLIQIETQIAQRLANQDAASAQQNSQAAQMQQQLLQKQKQELTNLGISSN